MMTYFRSNFNGTSRLFWENGYHYTRVSSGALPLTKKPEGCFLQYGNHIQNQLQSFDILTWKHRHISCCRLSLPKFVLFYFSAERNNSVCVSSLLLSKCALFYLWFFVPCFSDEYYAWTANQTLFLRYWFGPFHWRCIGTVLARISWKKKTYIPTNTKFVHTLLNQYDFNY